MSVVEFAEYLVKSIVKEKELGVEVVGETKMKISIEEDEEPWDDIDDEVTEEILEEIDKVDENYI